MEENNYTVYEHITPDGMYYFGTTSNIKKRWVCDGVNYKTTSLKPYINKFGWDNIQHKILFTNQTKDNALFIEDFLIHTAQEDGVCINKKRSGLISTNRKEYRSKFEREYQIEYRRTHREEQIEYQREYRRTHREDRREYRMKHREEHITYMRKYNQRKKCLKQLNEIGYIPLF